MQSAIGKGTYTFREVHRLTRVPLTTVRRWFLGGGKDGQLIAPDYAQTRGVHVVSFLDLLDAFVAAKFRDEGVPFRRLKKIYRNLVKRFGSEHPFCRDDVRTDGQTIFLDAAKAVGDAKLVDLLDGSLAIPKLLDPILTRLDFEDTRTGLATRWRIFPGVVVDPARNFGKPSVDRLNIATDVISDLLEAEEGDFSVVARWFGIGEEDVRTAWHFEQSLLEQPRAA